MTAETVQFFAAVTHPALVFGGPNGNFILIALGTGDPADPETIVDGVARGFRLVGYVGECRDCGGITTHTDLKTPDAAVLMILAPARYVAMRVLRQRSEIALRSLYQLKDPRPEVSEPQTIADMIWNLWERCLTTARNDEIPASAVELLIRESRTIIAQQGCTKSDSDLILFGVYERVHWDWTHPRYAIFEALLDFELQEFFAARISGRFGVN